MDFEKKYNEALERAKKVKHDIDNIGCAMDTDMLDIIFPELAESEDERIRKWIYSLVENLGYPADEDAEKELEEMQPLALAYLEKQKEQKPAEWSEEDEDMIQDIIASIDTQIAASDFHEMENWLKSLPMRCPKSSDNWKPSEEQMEVKGWAARDKDGMLRMHGEKPKRGKCLWESSGASHDISEFFSDDFIDWSDEPIEAELVIGSTRKEE